MDHNNYVKQVHICFKFRPHMPYAHAFRDFSSSWPEDLVFSSAYNLFVEIPEFFDQISNENIAFEKKKVYWLARRIPTALPKLQKVDLGISKPGLPDYEMSFDCTTKVDDFLSEISEKVKSFALAKGETSLPCGNQLMQNNVVLTKIHYGLGHDDLYIHIIRKSASTLVSLSFIDIYLRNIRPVFFNKENEPIVYPKLQKLRFYSYINSAISEKLNVDKNVALFPALKALRWDSWYIFDDDALFRGNNNTLEYLDIRSDVGIVDILERCKTFAAGKYSHLNHVSVHAFYGNYGAWDDFEMSTRFGINFITPATTVFSLRKQGLHGVDSIFAGTPNLENIRVLRFSRYNGTLRELIKIVKLLPNLSTLECVSGRIDFESDSTQFVNFIDGIYQDIYPLSHRFRHWKFIDENDYEIRPVTETALAFAILCTNFTFTRVPQGYRGYFRINIEKFIASGLYDKHIGRIQRLLRISN